MIERSDQLARERAWRVSSLGAREAGTVARMMKFWDGAVRASLNAGRTVSQACDAADRLCRLFAKRIGVRSEVTRVG